jgi:hypothetical protein
METTQHSHNMQLSSREEKASSTTLEGHVEHPDKASLPGNAILLGRASPPSYEEIGFSPPATSTPTDENLPPNITTDNSTGDSNHSTTQAVEPWQAQLQHLYTLLNNFKSEFNTKLEELRTAIPLPSQKIPIKPSYPPLTSTQSLDQLARDGVTVQESSKIALLQLRSDLQRLTPTKAVAVVVNSSHASAGSSDDVDADDAADMPPSPSYSLMGFFEPSSSPTAE